MVPTLQRNQDFSRSPLERMNRQTQSGPENSPHSILQRLQRAVVYTMMVPSLRIYFGHPAVIPSFALSLLYFTVLSFSGQMLTYLLASHINLWQVGVIRGVSTIFELSATWIAPRLMKRIGIVRTGLWSLSWQMTWLAGGFSWFFYYYANGYASTNLMPATGLAAAVALSRVGLWGYDLSAQNIVQDVSSRRVNRWLLRTDIGQGGTRRPPGHILDGRNVVPKRIRPALMGPDNRLVKPGLFPVAGPHQRCGCLHRRWALHLLPPSSAGTSRPPASMCGSQARRLKTSPVW